MFNSAPAILIQFVSLLGGRDVVGRGRGRRVFLVGGIQKLMETSLPIVVAVSLDRADISIAGRHCVDRPLRHVI